MRQPECLTKRSAAKVVYDELVKTIKERLPELHYDNLEQAFVKCVQYSQYIFILLQIPFCFSSHDKIDLDNLEASLTKRTVTM